MNVRRLLVAAVVTIGALIGFAPTSHASPRLACAWVNPHGVCISNPLDDLP
jgi:hypothetical protein